MTDYATVASVVNCREEGYDVYIGRGGPWGNPFRMGTHASRETVIRAFEAWMRESMDERARWIRAHIHELHGKRLGCYCAPLACHGDVLAKWAKVKSDERVGA